MKHTNVTYPEFDNFTVVKITLVYWGPNAEILRDKDDVCTMYHQTQMVHVNTHKKTNVVQWTKYG